MELFEDYLRRLEVAVRHLPPVQRRELVAEIRDHLYTSLAEEERPGPAELRNILERVGDPQEIAEAALIPPATSRPGGELEEEGPDSDSGLLTLSLLLFGGFLCAIGWLVGVALLWSSRRWTVAEKALGTALVPGGLLTPFLATILPDRCTTVIDAGGMISEEQCGRFTYIPWLDIVAISALWVAPILAAFLIFWRAKRRHGNFTQATVS
ncbi:HAAS signaling domain-containing protein [Streptomyces lavendofoliae]|uniref:HAAS signaling domain-containing protein n=1 Tax=Streptomyces lavendofoliae TaxID=67314 RepID=UPI003D8BE23F